MYGCHGHVIYGMDQLCMAVIANMDLLYMDQLCMATAEPNNGLAWYANFCQFHHLVHSSTEEIRASFFGGLHLASSVSELASLGAEQVCVSQLASLQSNCG